MNNGLLNTEVLCPTIWDGDMKIQLPWLPEGNLLHLSFTMPSKHHVEGLFRVVKRLDMYDARGPGYVQRLRLEPYHEDKA